MPLSLVSTIVPCDAAHDASCAAPAASTCFVALASHIYHMTKHSCTACCDMGWAGSCIEGYPAHSESMLLTALVRVLVCTVKHKVANAAPTIHVTVVLNSRQDILYAALYKGFLSIRRVT